MFFSSSTTRMFAILPSGQLQREATAAADFAVEMNTPAVRLDDITDDRKAQARGPDVAARRKLREAFENAFALLRRNARSAVPNGDQHGVVLRRGFHADPPTGWGVADGVGQQVGNRPREFGRITHD